MDAITAVSGSGPAYFALLAEAMIEAGLLLGLSREISTKLVVQTMLGTAKLLRDEHIHPVELREMVTSPGGTTTRAIRELEQAGVRAAFLNAINAAMERSKSSPAAMSEPPSSTSSTIRRRRSPSSSPRRPGAAGTSSSPAARLPRRAYELAAELEPNWSAAAVWWGDERCVPPGDQRSNYGLAGGPARPARRAPPEVHRMRGELLPRRGAPASTSRRSRRRRSTCSCSGSAPTATSPRSSRARRSSRSDAARRRGGGLEPFVERVTLTLPALLSARGSFPRHRRRQGRRGCPRVRRRVIADDAPASLVRAAEGTTRAILDRAAAAKL